MATTVSRDPLVWIDCEMTGLDPSTDQILSLSCYITTHDLDLLDPAGYHAIIHTPPQILANMSPWCIQTHGTTGLITACETSTLTAETASQALQSYIRRFCPVPGVAVLAGNTVYMDREFLRREPWSPVLGLLHYRVLDVSAIKEGVRRWCDENVLARVPAKMGKHVASDDITESIEEARFYMRLLRGGQKETKGGIE